jgi:hypothetical protein
MEKRKNTVPENETDSNNKSGKDSSGAPFIHSDHGGHCRIQRDHFGLGIEMDKPAFRLFGFAFVGFYIACGVCSGRHSGSRILGRSQQTDKGHPSDPDDDEDDQEGKEFDL